MRTVFTGGDVFDSRGATTSRADLAIEDGRIVDVGTGLDGDQEVDVSGKSLLPGLFDCHTHPLYSHVDEMRMLQTPFSYRFY
ncbi:MAG TPA: amidohydrolase family protein, partial [Actinomycetota bacterium]|nr:amidohydrolase family protein [Actinomycetota bacterium]